MDFGADVSAIPSALHGNKGFSRYPGVVTAAYSPHLFHGSGGMGGGFRVLPDSDKSLQELGRNQAAQTWEKTQFCHRFEIKIKIKMPIAVDRCRDRWRGCCAKKAPTAPTGQATPRLTEVVVPCTFLFSVFSEDAGL